MVLWFWLCDASVSGCENLLIGNSELKLFNGNDRFAAKNRQQMKNFDQWPAVG